MQFTDNPKTHFIYSKPLKYCNLSIDRGSKEKIHPIEKAIDEAEKFIYIISPYITEDMIDKLLEKENKKVNIKLLCTYTTINNDNNREIKETYLNILKKFILKQDFFKTKIAKKNLDDKCKEYEKFYSEKLGEYEKNIEVCLNKKKNSDNNIINHNNDISKNETKSKKIKSFIKCLYFLMYLIPICITIYGYFNGLSKNILVSFGIFFMILLSFILILNKQNSKKNSEVRILKEKIEKLRKENLNLIEKINESESEASKLKSAKDIFYIEKEQELKNIKNIPPKIEWRNLNFKMTKNEYNSSLKIPLIHTKLYLMDCPALTKSLNNKIGIKAFLGSANFTNAGFHKNYEFLLETTDLDFNKELVKYFNELYNSEEFQFLTEKEILQELQNKQKFDYPDI